MPRFDAEKHFEHQRNAKIGILVTNLGTPDEPNAKALKRYLREFLSDARVVEIPKLIWSIILNGIILQTRPKKSAEAYASVWQPGGSPLLIHTREQCNQIIQTFKHKYNDDYDKLFEIAFAMRYGNPSIKSQLEALRDKGCERILVLPLYPQYSGSTVGSTFDAIAKTMMKWRWVPEVRFINHYHDYPGFIKACVSKIHAHWNLHGQPDRLILSFHGVPKAYLMKGDPYHCQCHKTARLITEQLNIHADHVMVCFQSRFGRQEWLKPYLDETMKSIGQQPDINHIQVFCPGFSADCLETLEEIEEENKEYFLEAGGKKFEYIPALNEDEDHINFLCDLIHNHLAGWLEQSDAYDRSKTEQLYDTLKKSA